MSTNRPRGGCRRPPLLPTPSRRPLGDGTPDEEDQDGPEHGDNDALDIDPGHVALVEDRSGDVPAYDRPDDAQDDRTDQPFSSADDHVREKPCNGPEHDPADDAHPVFPFPIIVLAISLAALVRSRLRSHREPARASHIPARPATEPASF